MTFYEEVLGMICNSDLLQFAKNVFIYVILSHCLEKITFLMYSGILESILSAHSKKKKKS